MKRIKQIEKSKIKDDLKLIFLIVKIIIIIDIKSKNKAVLSPLCSTIDNTAKVNKINNKRKLNFILEFK